MPSIKQVRKAFGRGVGGGVKPQIDFNGGGGQKYFVYPQLQSPDKWHFAGDTHSAAPTQSAPYVQGQVPLNWAEVWTPELFHLLFSLSSTRQLSNLICVSAAPQPDSPAAQDSARATVKRQSSGCRYSRPKSNFTALIPQPNQRFRGVPLILWQKGKNVHSREKTASGSLLNVLSMHLSTRRRYQMKNSQNILFLELSS